jgi:hypothetical protein
LSASPKEMPFNKSSGQALPAMAVNGQKRKKKVKELVLLFRFSRNNYLSIVLAFVQSAWIGKGL